jgi:hypothetical protein
LFVLLKVILINVSTARECALLEDDVV